MSGFSERRAYRLFGAPRSLAAEAVHPEGGTQSDSTAPGITCWQRQSSGQSETAWQVLLQK